MTSRETDAAWNRTRAKGNTMTAFIAKQGKQGEAA